MCGQISDVFRYNERDFYLVGASNCRFFNCYEYGVPTMRTSTGCYRGFCAKFAVDEKKRLILDSLEANPLNQTIELGRAVAEKKRMVAALRRLEYESWWVQAFNLLKIKRLLRRVYDLERNVIPNAKGREDDLGQSPVSEVRLRRSLTSFRRQVAEACLPEEAPTLNGVKAELMTKEERERSGSFSFRYSNVGAPIRFSGSLLIGADYRDDCYRSWEFAGHYCFQTILELRFKNGVLKKTIDRSDVAAALWRLEEEANDGEQAQEKERRVEPRTRRYERRALKWMENLTPYWYPGNMIYSFHWFGR
jgi:hypothetical protein